MSRNKSHERAKKPKNTLAASSLFEYLKTLAASIKTSLASCSANIIDPILKNLQTKRRFVNNQDFTNCPILKETKNYNSLVLNYNGL